MSNKILFAALLGLTAAGGIGATSAAAEPVMAEPPYFFIVRGTKVTPSEQPKTQQDIVGHTNTAHPRPVYRWEKELQEDTAARELIQEQLTGRQPDENYDGFFENYYRTYNY